MPRRIEKKYLRLWAPEELDYPDPDGFNAFKILTPLEHLCWIKLRCLCAMTEMQPVICQTPYVGYSDSVIAQTFGVELKVWVSCKQKLMFSERISVDPQNVIRILHWDRYSGRYLKGRQDRDGEFKLWTEEDEEKRRGVNKIKAELFKEIIAHLNLASGKKFQVGSGESYKHFSRRFDEGATIENFKHVIDVKCAQWLGQEKMEPMIRPQTLFNSRTFWDYVAEPPVRKKWKVGNPYDYGLFPEELAKYEEEAKKDYQKRRDEFVARMGKKNEDELSLDELCSIPPFKIFFGEWMKKKRESPDWSLT